MKTDNDGLEREKSRDRNHRTTDERERKGRDRPASRGGEAEARAARHQLFQRGVGFSVKTANHIASGAAVARRRSCGSEGRDIAGSRRAPARYRRRRNMFPFIEGEGRRSNLPFDGSIDGLVERSLEI